MKKLITILGMLIFCACFKCHAQCTATTPIIQQGASQSISCGGTAQITVDNWCGGCSYVWSNGDAGINIAVSPSTTTCYTVTVTDNNGCTATSSQHCVNVPSATTPIIQQGSSVTICQGDTTQITVQNWCGGCSYAWSNGDAGINIAVTQAGSYTVTVTDNNGCQATSSFYTVTVNPLVTPSVSISPSPSTTICLGQTALFNATPTNEGSSPIYQWYLNGNPVGTNSANYTTPALFVNTQVYCIMTSNANCASPTTATSGTTTITISSIIQASVDISVSPNDTICAGDNVIFTATNTNNIPSPSYQWKLNISNVGTNNTYSNSSLANGDQINCVISSSSSCVTGSPATSNTITMTVDTCTGIEEIDFINNLNIYPNPNTGNFVIEMEITKVTDLEIKLLNIIGQIIYEEKVNKYSGVYQKEIDLPNIKSGVYYLDIQTKEGVIRKEISVVR